MARKSRGLTGEDERLWGRVIAGATPLPGRRGGTDAAVPPPLSAQKSMDPQQVNARQAAAQNAIPPRAEPAPAWLVEPFQIGIVSGSSRATARLSTGMAQHLSDAPVRMDFHTHRRLRKGKLTPDARMDLHGMTLAAAMPALTVFILRAQASGQRLVLVITGKGHGGGTDPGPLPTRRGALRHSVPHWLHMPPLAQVVAQVLPAHDRHGGGGAYYVWLRKARR